MATRGQQKKAKTGSASQMKKLQETNKRVKSLVQRTKDDLEKARAKKATPNATKTKAELTKLEKEAEKKSAERQQANRAKSRAEMRKRTQPNAVKSKAELTKLEKEAEKKSAQRQAANKGQSRAEMSKRTPPKPGKRRAAVAERRKIAGRDSNLRTEDRRPKGPTTTKKVADTASRVGRLARGMTGIGAAVQSEKLGGGRDTMKGIESRRNEFVDRETKRQAKAKEKNYNLGVSKGGVPFREAFAHFRKKGAKTFTWNGKKYTTEMKKGK